MDVRKIARKYIQNGFSVIPLKANKTPALYWQKYQKQLMTEDEIEKYFKDTEGIGLVCGAISGNLVAIDEDLKYDISGDLHERFLRSLPKNILDKVAINKTKNNGYHLIFRVEKDTGQGNKKLASRPTTSDEKKETYKLNREKGKNKEEAIKIAQNDKLRVLIETRENGGYIVIPPSDGYKHIKGKIGVLTTEEYIEVKESAMSFNEYVEKKDVVYKKPLKRNGSYGKSPFEDFNERGDIHSILINNGWEYVFENSLRVFYKRPGQTNSKTSANFNKELRLFHVFSTSTVFESGKGYTPASVFLKLECNDDVKLCANKLLDMGSGERDEKADYVEKLKRRIKELEKKIEKNLAN